MTAHSAPKLTPADRAAIAARERLDHELTAYRWPYNREENPPPGDDWFVLRNPTEVAEMCHALAISPDTSEGTDRAAEDVARRLQLHGVWARRAHITEAIRRRTTVTDSQPDDDLAAARATTRQLLDAVAHIDEADRVAIARRCARRCDEHYTRLQTHERRHQTDRARAEAAIVLGYGLAAALLAAPTAPHWRTVLGLDDDRSQPS